MKEQIFDVFNGFRDAFVSEAHYQLMNDLPMLTEYSRFASDARIWFASNLVVTSLNATNIAVFLPPTKHEIIDDYLRRLAQTAPFNVYKAAVNAVIGLMGRKPAKIENEDLAEADYLDTVYNGDWWGSCLKTAVFPAAMGGIGGILVDYQNNLPVWQVFDDRAISRKHMIKERIVGKEVLKRATITTIEKREREDAEFEYIEIRKCLCLKLIDVSHERDWMAGVEIAFTAGKDPAHFLAVWEVYEQQDGKPEVIRSSWGVYRSKLGQPLNSLPFHCFQSTSTGDSPFSSAAKRAFKQISMASFYEQAIQIANHPMLVYKSDSGGLPSEIDDSGTEQKTILKISPRAIFEIGMDDSIDWLEWTGSSFEVTRGVLRDMVSEIAAMIVTTSPDQQTQRTKAEYEGQQTTDTSHLLDIAESCEVAVQAAIATSHFFMGLNSETMPVIALNKDFIKNQAVSGFIDELLKLYESRILSGSTLLQAATEKEIIPETSMKIEQEKIAQEELDYGTAPALTMPTRWNSGKPA